MSEPIVVRIGVIADTQGLFDPALIEHFAGVTAIIHAGDIGEPDVIRQLKQIAPVIAVSGNVDEFEQSGFPRARVIRRAGVTIGIRHILFERGKLTPEAKEWLDNEQPDVCVFGHSHRPTIEQYGPTLLFNPGSAGPKRFSQPRGIGMLAISGKTVSYRLVGLEIGSLNQVGGIPGRGGNAKWIFNYQSATFWGAWRMTQAARKPLT